MHTQNKRTNEKVEMVVQIIPRFAPSIHQDLENTWREEKGANRLTNGGVTICAKNFDMGEGSTLWSGEYEKTEKRRRPWTLGKIHIRAFGIQPKLVYLVPFQLSLPTNCR
jgi:hypothetical protein